MEITHIILISIVSLIVLYIILNWVYGTTTQLTNMFDAHKQQSIVASTLPTSSNSSNYTYSTWFYVNDWNYRFGEPKILLGRHDNEKNPSPSIVFGAMENDITISVACYSQDKQNDNKYKIHACNIKNFPLQKWVNLIVSLYGRTLDVYIDGKLVRTCVLPGVAKVNQNANIIVTPKGGFSGVTTNFQYWNDATNPQQAYNIYKDGIGGSIFGNFFNKYRVKISFLADDKEKSSFEI
jgi:hypothetical protein